MCDGYQSSFVVCGVLLLPGRLTASVSDDVFRLQLHNEQHGLYHAIPSSRVY